ncbi:MAG: TonB-dependent siderophore receptor [Rhodanobacteraceae bacterium]|nr:TonB-dependent siderophore receptor [Rhodanobacteraceae bacterium]
MKSKPTTTLDKVDVTAASRRKSRLDAPAETASRLGLSARETPASVDLLTQEDMQARGARSTNEAVLAAPGVTAANLPSAPGSLSLRGFTGGAISLLFDGVRQTAAPLVARDFDLWSFERIEVLKGPASVLYGEGALAGAVNLVPKRPLRDTHLISGMLSGGSFGSTRLGFDANVALNTDAALRTVLSHRRSDGYVDDTASEAFAGTFSASWQPRDDLQIDLAYDHFSDDYATAYWGTPLVPLATARNPSSLVRSANGQVLDRALRKANYNVDNGLQDAESDWLRTRMSLQISDSLRFSNELSAVDTTRRWRNAETYTFNAATGLLDRSLTHIQHDHQYWLERAALSSDTEIGSRRNRFTVGMELSRNDFFTVRRFGTTTSVDPYRPMRGLFPLGDTSAMFPGAGNRANFDSATTVRSVFLENAFNLTPRWLMLGGARYDHIVLDRSVRDLNANTLTEFDRTYQPLSWRVGTVFELTPDAQLYAQYSVASAPVGSMLLISLANSRFNLTTGRALDAGLKMSLLDDRVDFTVGGYAIQQDDIITRDPANPAISVQGGRQSSRGLEAAVSARLSEALRIDANLAVLDARFDTLVEAGGANRAGNTPPNVPQQMASVFAAYQISGTPLTVSAGLRHVGYFYTNNANTIRVGRHTVYDAAIACRLPFGELALRGRNLSDALYADWAGGAASQVVLGAPRSVELGLTVAF